jgi:hypothetical protein
LAKASVRQRSSVATLMPTSRDTTSITELSGGSDRATFAGFDPALHQKHWRGLGNMGRQTIHNLWS